MRLADINKWAFDHVILFAFFRVLLKPLKNIIKLACFNVRWRKNNMHNSTSAINVFPIDKVRVGKRTYGDLRVISFEEDESYLQIGNFCSIAGDVVFILGGNHPTRNLSTFPFVGIRNENQVEQISSTKGPIIIGDDVWIGHGAIILSGVEIGTGAVIAAGSVVPRSIPSYAIFAGTEIKKFRFPAEIIAVLKEIDLLKLDRPLTSEDEKFLLQEVTIGNVQELIMGLSLK